MRATAARAYGLTLDGVDGDVTRGLWIPCDEIPAAKGDVLAYNRRRESLIAPA